MSFFKSKFFVAFLVIVAIVVGVYVIYSNYFDSGVKIRKQMLAQQKVYESFVKRYEDAMRADTYGGKTPEETLQMFIDALKKGDIELASKYFMLDTNENSPYYLTRKKWEDGLKKTQAENRINELIHVISSVRHDIKASSQILNTAIFVFSDDNDQIKYDIDLELNKYSGVWKISSL